MEDDYYVRGCNGDGRWFHLDGARTEEEAVYKVDDYRDDWERIQVRQATTKEVVFDTETED
jgi:hypothetical protein